jgi:hypothetical protein
MNRSHESSQNSSGEKYKTYEQVFIYLQYFYYIFHYETGLQEGEKYDEFIVPRSDNCSTGRLFYKSPTMGTSVGIILF